jgi:hypothetical protein
MKSSLPTKESTGTTISPPRRFRKRVFCVLGKTLIIIHPELVKSLRINEDTWFDEIETDSGVSLTICSLLEQEKTTTNTRSNESKDMESQ